MVFVVFPKVQTVVIPIVDLERTVERNVWLTEDFGDVVEVLELGSSYRISYNRSPS